MAAADAGLRSSSRFGRPILPSRAAIVASGQVGPLLAAGGSPPPAHIAARAHSPGYTPFDLQLSTAQQQVRSFIAPLFCRNVCTKLLCSVLVDINMCPAQCAPVNNCYFGSFGQRVSPNVLFDREAGGFVRPWKVGDGSFDVHT
jgi:hypothetical protein